MKAKPSEQSNLEKIKQANYANCLKKLKSGKTLTDQELRVVEEFAAADRYGIAKNMAAAASMTGLSLQTIKRLKASGAGPDIFKANGNIDCDKLMQWAESHQASLSPNKTEEARDKIYVETWRKLKIANDAKDGRLQAADKESEWLGSILTAARELLEQKLVNEYPSLVENLDAPQIRVRAKKLFDDIMEKLQPLGRRFAK